MQKEQIYEIMIGSVEPREVALPGKLTIANEFGKGRECGKLYDRVYAAKTRLSNRLGGNEDRDVKEIITCMCSIAEILSLKMYEYGAGVSEVLQGKRKDCVSSGKRVLALDRETV